MVFFFPLCVRWTGFSSLEKWLFLTWFLIGEVTYFKCHYLTGHIVIQLSIIYKTKTKI